MRVDYTLPALQPGTVLELPEGTEAAEGGRSPSFREQLQGVSVPLPVSVEQQLRLDARPGGATLIGPPPRPRTLELNDAETERARWRNMLFRHSQGLAPGGSPATSGSRQSVQTMLDMLLDMQNLEDSIMYRNAAVTRG